MVFNNCNITDIDECEADIYACGSDAICNNTHGSFNCTCKPGYKGDGKNCTGNFLFTVWSARMVSKASCVCLFVCFISFYFLNNLIRL